jgi:hypothetical protein
MKFSLCILPSDVVCDVGLCGDISKVRKRAGLLTR